MLSQTSLAELKQDLQDLIDNLNTGVEQTTKELGEKSLEYMQKQYSENNLEGHIGNINLHAYNKRYQNGFKISSGDDIVAVFNEFGTGLRGAYTKTDLAAATGYEYNVPSPSKGKIPEGAIAQWGKDFCEVVTTPYTWWYWKNGTWRWTDGMGGKNMYGSLVEELRELAPRQYNTKVSQVIGNYRGGNK